MKLLNESDKEVHGPFEKLTVFNVYAACYACMSEALKIEC